MKYFIKYTDKIMTATVTRKAKYPQKNIYFLYKNILYERI